MSGSLRPIQTEAACIKETINILAAALPSHKPLRPSGIRSDVGRTSRLCPDALRIHAGHLCWQVAPSHASPRFRRTTSLLWNLLKYCCCNSHSKDAYFSYLVSDSQCRVLNETCRARIRACANMPLAWSSLNALRKPTAPLKTFFCSWERNQPHVHAVRTWPRAFFRASAPLSFSHSRDHLRCSRRSCEGDVARHLRLLFEARSGSWRIFGAESRATLAYWIAMEFLRAARIYRT